MMVEWVTALVQVAMGYAAIGLVFGLVFVFFLVGKIDPLAKRGTLGFRFLILPGVAALWPLLLFRLLGGVTSPPIERNAHRKAAQIRRT